MPHAYAPPSLGLEKEPLTGPTRAWDAPGAASSKTAPIPRPVSPITPLLTPDPNRGCRPARAANYRCRNKELLVL